MAYEMRGNTLFNVQEPAQSNQPMTTPNGNPGGIYNNKRPSKPNQIPHRPKPGIDMRAQGGMYMPQYGSNPMDVASQFQQFYNQAGSMDPTSQMIEHYMQRGQMRADEYSGAPQGGGGFEGGYGQPVQRGQMILPEFMYGMQGPGVHMGGQNPALGRYRPPTMASRGSYGGSGGPEAPTWNDYGGYAYNLPNAYGMWQGTPEMYGWGGAQQQMYPDYIPMMGMGPQFMRGGRNRRRQPMMRPEGRDMVLPEFMGGY